MDVWRTPTYQLREYRMELHVALRVGELSSSEVLLTDGSRVGDAADPGLLFVPGIQSDGVSVPGVDARVGERRAVTCTRDLHRHPERCTGLTRSDIGPGHWIR